MMNSEVTEPIKITGGEERGCRAWEQKTFSDDTSITRTRGIRPSGYSGGQESKGGKGKTGMT